MPDYDDWNTWKEVDFPEDHTTNEYAEYSPEDVFKICQELIENAEQAGLQGCFIKFNSQNEPYETWLASPTISVAGYRKLTEEENADLAMQEEIENIAVELKTNIPNARAVYELRKEGKL